MMRSCLVLVVLTACVVTGNGEYLRSMQGMRGLSIKCNTQKELSFVHSWVRHPELDFLRITKVLGEEIKVLVTEKALSQFTAALSDNKIAYETFVDNVANVVRDDYLKNEFARRIALSSKAGSSNPFTFFPRISEIQSYLQDLAKNYNKVVSLLNIGSSYEGNPLMVVKISSGPGKKPALFIDAGIHAREWIAPSTALWAIHQLVANDTNRQLYENVDWYILPSLNPDGYEFTHTSSRMWRKTRSPNPGSSCAGTDPNRNFDLEWMTTGASDEPCADDYAGSKPFSEKETSALRDFILAHKENIKAYLTLHSYGKYLLHPWGYTEELPENEPELRSVAVAAEKALAAVQGTRYTIGSSTNVLYAAAGGSDDWVMGIAGVPLSYTIELPGDGGFGFNPPPSEIKPVGIETFEAFKVFSKYIESKYA